MKKSFIKLKIYIGVITSLFLPILLCCFKRVGKIIRSLFLEIRDIFCVVAKKIKKIFVEKIMYSIFSLELKDILEILTIIIIFATLREMQIQRNQAYSPDLYVDKKQMYIAESSMRDQDSFIKNSYNYNKHMDLLNIEGNSDLSINMSNVGVGVARDVEIQWDHENYGILMNMLNIVKNPKESILANKFIDKSKQYYRSEIDTVITMKTYSIGGVTYQKWSYIRPNTDDKCNIEFPLYYYAIIKATVNSLKYIQDIQGVYFLRNIDLGSTLSYRDTQGKLYSHRIVFHLTLSYDFFPSENPFEHRTMVMYNIEAEEK